MDLKKIRLKKVYYILMFLLLVITLITSVVGFKYSRLIDYFVIFVFGLDTFYHLKISLNKKNYFYTHILEFVSLIPVSPVFRLFRIVTIFLGFIRLTVLGKKYIVPVTKKMNEYFIGRVILYLLIIFFLFPLPLLWIEPNITNYSDLLWWTIQTITTVGYGDILITTNVGRLIASILMLFGIGMIGMMTSSITKLMLYQKKINSYKNISKLNTLEEINKELMELKSRERLLNDKKNKLKRNLG